MSIAESQACGTPVIAFNVAGVGDAISPECRKLLCADGDFNGMLDALEVVEREKLINNTCRKLDRAWSKKHFEASSISALQKRVYEEHVLSDDSRL